MNPTPRILPSCSVGHVNFKVTSYRQGTTLYSKLGKTEGEKIIFICSQISKYLRQHTLLKQGQEGKAGTRAEKQYAPWRGKMAKAKNTITNYI